MIGEAGTDMVQEALQELQADVAELAPAVKQALLQCRRDDPFAWENLNAYDVLTLDLFLTFITLATPDHEIAEAEQGIINTVGSAMEAGAGYGASELYRRAWNAFTAGDYERPCCISLLRDHYDRVHQTNRAMEARLSLYGFACTVAEIDELVPESEEEALDAFYDALYYDV